MSSKLIDRTRYAMGMKPVGLVVYCAALVWSAINPYDYFTWFLEAAPALIALVIPVGNSPAVSVDLAGLRFDSDPLPHSLFGRALYLRRSRCLSIYPRLVRLAEK